MHREQEAYLLPNEKEEVVLYDQFCGDNSILKFEIRLKNINMLFLTSFYANF